jgi:5-methylcytosine-specific restriction protein B
MGIPRGIRREHVDEALRRLASGEKHSFGRERTWQVLYEGKPYPPKAVVGIAAEVATGEPLTHKDFRGGELPGQANALLRSLGFQVTAKDGIAGNRESESRQGRRGAANRSRGDSVPDNKRTRYSERSRPYTPAEALDDLFLEPGEFEQMLALLRRKKNVVLEGPPGVGKTFVARRLAFSLMGREDPTRLKAVQFHQSYGYEDFVRGWRPREKGGYTSQDGIFLRFCESARSGQPEPYVLVIDEINRGNLSRIFGELLMLLEADKRRPEDGVELALARPREKPFWVPPNLYVIGIMNTADRSLAIVDYALRRRFAFIDVKPKFESDRFSTFLRRRGMPGQLITRIRRRMKVLNKAILDDKNHLGPGYEIGHSFFCPVDGEHTFDDAWYETVIRSEIEPLLREYWFDDREKVRRRVAELLEP